MIQELNLEEMMSIDGGHDGDAYNAGVAVGHALVKVGTILGIIAFFSS